MKRDRDDGPRGSRRGYAPWLAVDVVLIAFFASLGHLSHYGTPSLSGVAFTALPFLAAYLTTMAILRPWRRTTALFGTAVPLWIGTAAGGLTLRVFSGESAALSFQIVALCVLGVFLVVPRAIAAVVRRRRRNRPVILPSPSHNQGAAT